MSRGKGGRDGRCVVTAVDRAERYGIGITFVPPSAVYQLPPGWTWRRVVAERVRWLIADDHYPLATVGGICTAWGRPLGVAVDA